MFILVFKQAEAIQEALFKMKYRKQTSRDDFSFGNGLNDFYIDMPEAVGQAVVTRLLLIKGEWFLNTDEGCDYKNNILGKNRVQKAELEIRRVILETEGVVEIDEFFINFNAETRALNVSAKINTVYGVAVINEVV